MLANYVKVALRGILRSKSYSLINVAGLAAGMTCCLLILLFVRNEFSYDRFHENYHRIFRATQDWHYASGDVVQHGSTPGILADALRNDFDAVESAVRLHPLYNDLYFSDGERGFYEGAGFFAEPQIFEVFSFRLRHGDSTTALTGPHKIVLTPRSALKFFGTEDAIARTLTVRDSIALEVTGILEEVPDNSHLQFEFLISFDTMRALGMRGATPESMAVWANLGWRTYALLDAADSVDRVNEQLFDVSTRYAGDWERKHNTLFRHYLQPLKDLYLRSSHLYFEWGPRGQIDHVYALGAVGALILTICCVNYVNLSTARSVRRAREVGMRKVVGASRRQLIVQFTGEALMVVGAATALSMLAVEMAVPLVNELTEKQLSFAPLPDPLLGIGLIVAVGVVGIASGIYPAFALSRFLPSRALAACGESR